MKLAILGGSFNPVHLGHLYLAETVLSTLGYDRVILIPAFISPFKPGVQNTSAADRLDMLAASITADPRLVIDDCEIKREGVSYTIDTITDITARYRPEGKLGLIVGDDLAANFSLWRRADDIAEQADIIIARRLPSGSVTFPYPSKQLDNAVMDLSSGDIRDRIQKGKHWRYLIPEGARFIIEDRRLYGYTPKETEMISNIPAFSHQLIARIEGTVRSMVSSSRFLHSRWVACLARDLCLRFGLDAERGYLAGIAHDMAKSLSEDELRRLVKRDGDGKISKLEQAKPSLLHARAAAVMLREWFGIEDEDILNAVRLHTSGSLEMESLAKIVYIADKVEISRPHVKGELRELERYPDLDSYFTAVLEDTVAFLRSRQLELSEGTQRLLTAIHKRSSL
ncbi:nicotinate-nucleotide adenylyltransferase [Spirochaetia bacterium]|nr:nicotinate-nucleotide adenylyltransferase [Spirochaetia bacterium]